jgi:hypothetical protein
MTACPAPTLAARHVARLIARYLALLVAPLALAGCSTVMLPSQQEVQILAFDAADRPVTGMTCKVSNQMGESTVTTPAIDVPVRRSFSDLQIECRRGNDVAMGTVVPRRHGLEQALVPFGSVAVAIDHISGHLYAYPTVVRLRLGQHLRFEFSTEARAAGLIATVGDTMVVDLGATPAPREPLPELAPTAAPAKGAATKPAARPRPAPRPAATSTARTEPAQDSTVRRSAPVNW